MVELNRRGVVDERAQVADKKGVEVVDHEVVGIDLESGLDLLDTCFGSRAVQGLLSGVL